MKTVIDKIGSSVNLQAWLIFGFAFILYAQTVSFEYVLDDGLMITENKFTRRGMDGLWAIFTHDQFSGITGEETNSLYSGGRYRPLSQAVFAVEWEFFGNNPFIGHLVMILFYSALCMLIFKTLLLIFKNEKSKPWYFQFAFLITVFYVAHPIHTEVVANIKSLDEVLAMLGGVFVLFFSLKYLKDPSVKWLALSFALLMVGLFAKENAITFAGIIPVILFMFKKVKFIDYVKLMTPMLVGVLVYLGVRYAVFGFITSHVDATELNHNPFMFATATERFATIVYTWGNYWMLLLFPINLTHDYYPWQIPVMNWSNMWVLVSLVVNIGLILYALYGGIKKQVIAFGILFFYITFSVTSNLVFDLGLMLNERFMFVSSLGFLISLIILLDKLLFKYSKLYGYVLLLILSLYSLKTVSRSRAWKDGHSLFYTDVKTSSNSGRCNAIAGMLLLDDARKIEDSLEKKVILLKAKKYLVKGLVLNPRNPGAWGALGETYIHLKQLDSSFIAYKELINRSPNNMTAINNMYYLAEQYALLQNRDQAIAVMDFLIKSYKDNSRYYVTKTLYMLEQGRVNESIDLLNNVIVQEPKAIAAYNQLAEIWGKHKMNIDMSLQYLNKAYKLDSTNLQTLENLGVALGIKGNYQAALTYLLKAQNREPNKKQLLQNIAQTYSLLGDKEKADQYIQLAGSVK